MNEHTLEADALRVEAEADALAPAIRDAYARLGGPSAATLQRIRLAAEAHTAARRRHRAFVRFARAGAAAALVAAAVGGSYQLRLAFQTAAPHPHAALGSLLAIGAPDGALPEDGAAELANRLLDLQGLSKEAFIRPEEQESLWL